MATSRTLDPRFDLWSLTLRAGAAGRSVVSYPSATGVHALERCELPGCRAFNTSGLLAAHVPVQVVEIVLGGADMPPLGRTHWLSGRKSAESVSAGWGAFSRKTHMSSATSVRHHRGVISPVLRLFAAAATAALVGSSFVGLPSASAVPSAEQGSSPLVVSPRGSNASPGTPDAPMRTIGRAVSAAKPGQTIMVHGGSYHESVTIPDGKTLHLRAYPGESVRLEGSRVVSKFTAGDKSWVAENWTTEFDSSPTHTRGATDSAKQGWGFVNPKYPLAAHPDQVWVDGAAQKQVGSRAAVRPGTFYVDYAQDRLYLGSNPAGKTVRASDLVRGLAIRAANSSVEGIDVRRFAPSVPDMGAVTVERPGVSLDDMQISDNATTGLHVGATDAQLTGLVLQRNGMLGANTVYADRLSVRDMTAHGNNTEHFNSSPVSGGLKITRSRGVEVQDSVFDSNAGPGLWLDESVYDADIWGNKMTNNAGHGISLEISAKITVADNVIVGNGGHGVKVNNTSSVQIWNNTISGTGRALNIVQDARRASNPSTPGHDKRRPIPDPTMTWVNRGITVGNNVLSSTGTSGNCLLCVEDYSRTYTAEQMVASTNGNLYHRASATAPRWSVVWSNGAAGPSVFTKLSAFSSREAQERPAAEITGGRVLTDDNRIASGVASKYAGIARPLPAGPADLMDVPTGTKRIGALHS